MRLIPRIRTRGVALMLAVGLITPVATLVALGTLAPPAGALTGDITTVAGGGSSATNVDGVAASNATLNNPTSVAVDGHGNQLIADSLDHRIRVIAKSMGNPGYPLLDANCGGTCTWTPGDIFTIAGTGSQGYTGDGLVATAATLHSPADVAVDPGGNLIIADQGNSAIRVIAMSVANPGYSLRADCAGTCTWSAGHIFTIAGNGSQGYAGDGSGGPSSNAQLSAPGNVALDAQGNVLIADTVNARLRVIAMSATNPGYQLNAGVWTIGSIFTFAGSGSSGFGGDAHNAIDNSVKLNNPHGLTVDPGGNVLFADTSNNLIRVIAVNATDPGYSLHAATWAAGDIFTIAGHDPNQSGYGGDGTDAVSNSVKLSAPNDVTVDANGNIVIADLSNDRVRIIAVTSFTTFYPLAGCVSTCTWTVGDIFTIAGNGTAGFGGDGGSAIAPGNAGAKLDFPEGVAFDPQGNLLIADELNLRVRSVQYGDGFHFTVPATAPDPNGYDSGYAVANTVALQASGSWCTNNTASLCTDQVGNAGFPKTDNFVNQSAPAWGLLARIGTSGPWTPVGNGASLSGTGELYFIMNDDIDSNCGVGSVQNCFLDNTGTLDVAVTAAMSLHTKYNATGPVLAGRNLSWEGMAINTGTTTLTGVVAVASDGSYGTPIQSAAPTWATFAPNGEVFDQTDSGTCVLFFGWDCVAGPVVPGGYITVDSQIATQGAAPPTTLTDAFNILSDQSDVVTAPVSTQRIDGVAFHITAPSQVYDGDVLTASGFVSNTSATATIHGIITYGAIDKGSFISGPSYCESTNNVPLGTGGIERCFGSTNPPPTFDLPPGASSGTSSFNIDTTGLAGQSINYTDFATSPDIGGVSQLVTGSVPVVLPGIEVAPANNATLARSFANDFTATPTADSGDVITSVDLKLDGVTQASPTVPPYTFTFAPSTLTAGSHTLTATAHQGVGADLTKTITVNVVSRPTESITPPSGFVSGGSVLNTAQTFTGIATPNSPATIASIAWDVDGTPVAAVPGFPGVLTLDPSKVVLTDGSHTLNMTATDSVGQSRTASLNFNVPLATLQVCSADPLFNINSCNTPIQPIGTPPAPATVTANADAAWTVQVDNTSNVVARHAVLTLDASATDTFNVQTALAFDEAPINGALGRPVATDSCQQVGVTIVCALPDIPASSAVQFPVFAMTGNVSLNSTVGGDANASAANAAATGPVAFAPDTVVTCGQPGQGCIQTTAAAGTNVTTADAGPTASDPTAVSLDVPASGQAVAKAIRFGRPFPLSRTRLPTGTALRLSRITFKPRVNTDPSLKVTLASIDPLTATDPASISLCTTAVAGAGACQGQISQVSAAFDPYISTVNPLLVVISALWGPSGPPGHLYVQKANSAGAPIGGPVLLPLCIQDGASRAFTNTPCRLPEIVKTLTINGVTTKTSYSPILFIGTDPHFARR